MESLEWVEFKQMLEELDLVTSKEDAKAWWDKYVPDHQFPDTQIGFSAAAIHILATKILNFGLLG